MSESVPDQMFKDFEDLRKELHLADDARLEFLSASLLTARVGTTRGEFNWIHLVPQIVEAAKAMSPFACMALLILQWLINRDQRYREIVAEVVGLLQGSGLSGKELLLVRQHAESE